MADHGTGAIQSPPDERDLLVNSEQLRQLAAASIIPATYRVPTRPPITDQGVTPQCVAYSTAYEQNEQDEREHGHFYNFDENTLFYTIGGTSNGAVMRYALDRMEQYGYPEQGGGNADRHKISGYFQVAFQDLDDLKRAIITFGGVLVIMQWFQSWQYPGLDNVLPNPAGTISGHAWWAVGWDDNGNIVGQNSWGTLWGENGLFKMPYAYIRQYAWEVWKTADDLTLSTVAKARIRSTGVKIRNYLVKRDNYVLDHRSHWATTRTKGIRRESDGKLVESPWDKAFRIKGFHQGARHGYGRHPHRWVELSINNVSRYVPRALVRLVNR